MPVAATRQADVGTADPQPVEALRGGQQLIEQFAVCGLDGGALGQRASRLRDPAGEGIANLLEIAEVEHPRWAGGADPVGHGDPAEPLGDQPRELTLELADLSPQLGTRQTLVDYDSVEHSPHSEILSGLEGRCSNP